MANMEDLSVSRKRASPAPPPWSQRPIKDHRRHHQTTPRAIECDSDGIVKRKEQENFSREQTRLNQIQEAQQMREWVSKEDEFVLIQSMKKARIRVKEGRAKTIDWLAATLSVLEPSLDALEDDGDQSDVDVVDPAGLLEGLEHQRLQGLVKDIETYLTLETKSLNRNYWNVRSPWEMDWQATNWEF